MHAYNSVYFNSVLDEIFVFFDRLFPTLYGYNTSFVNQKKCFGDGKNTRDALDWSRFYKEQTKLMCHYWERDLTCYFWLKVCCTLSWCNTCLYGRCRKTATAAYNVISECSLVAVFKTAVIYLTNEYSPLKVSSAYFNDR